MPEQSLIRYLSTTPPFGLGTAAFGGTHWGPQSASDSTAALLTAIEGGVTHIDTAAAYGGGRSETSIGLLLKRRPQLRGSLLIASKGGIKGSEANFRAEIEKSRRRLGTETIDIYYIHWPKSGVDPRPSLDALARARSDGLIRWAGVSNFPLRLAAAAHTHIGIDALQFGYNLFWREAQRDLIPFCRRNGIAAVAYGALAQGLLSGRIGPATAFPEGDDRNRTLFYREDVRDRLFGAVAGMRREAEAAGLSLAECVLGWCIDRGAADHYLIGARNAAQAAKNFRSPAIPRPLLDMLDAAGRAVADLFSGEDNFFGFDW